MKQRKTDFNLHPQTEQCKQDSLTITRNYKAAGFELQQHKEKYSHIIKAKSELNAARPAEWSRARRASALLRWLIAWQEVASNMAWRINYSTFRLPSTPFKFTHPFAEAAGQGSMGVACAGQHPHDGAT